MKNDDRKANREECEFCGREIDEGEGHECFGTRAEAADYARVEDDHR